MEEFGSYLKSIRKEKNITLKMLSKELNVGVPFLSLIENGKKPVPINYADKISVALNLTGEEHNKLVDSIRYSNKTILFDLSELSTEQKELVILFKNNVTSLSLEQIERIKGLLGYDKI
ncbi:MAG: helix-turn-helix transcriptional regulator [Bacilli bacterium]|nr:helix-turn-helix transcriptional regulator [Bacilli bacterium]